MHKLYKINNENLSKPEISGFLSVAGFKELAYLLTHRKNVAKLCAKFIKKLGDVSGLEPGFKIPLHLANTDANLWEGLSLLIKMRRLGMVKSWKFGYGGFPDEPALFYFNVINNFKEGTFITDSHNGKGSHFSDLSKAIWPAIGEAVDRHMFVEYSPKKNYVDSSFKNIKNEAINIYALAGLSKEERGRKHPNFPQGLTFDESTQFRWVRGYSLTQKRKLWVPLQLVTRKGHTDFKEPVLRSITTSGIAVHRTEREAILNSALEVLERDAFMITWINRLAPQRISLQSIHDETLRKTFDRFKRYNLDLHLLYMPTDFPIHAICAVVIDKTGVGPAVAIGASAHFDIVEAISKAMREAIAVRTSLRSWRESSKIKNEKIDLENISRFGKKERMFYWYDLKKIDDIQFILRGHQMPLENLPKYPATHTTKEKLRYLTSAFKERGVEFSYVSIDDERLRKLKLHCVWTIAPELQPLYLFEGLPYRSGARLKTVPLACGFQYLDSPHTAVHPFP